jgi:peptidoglycan/LPS O-acetylase OafA/YrhL
LHLELYGSLLVLGLVTLRGRLGWVYWVAIVAAAVLFGAHPMFLFVLGHLSAPLLVRPRGRSATVLGASMLVLGVALCSSKDWRVVEALRVWLSQAELAFAPNLFQFQSQLAAVVLYFGVLMCPGVWRVLESGACRRLGRLSFSIYLLHFPILFTLVCAAFIPVRHVLPYAGAVGVAFALFLVLTLVAAMLFERWVDRPAIALSRRAGGVRWQAA